MEPPDDDYVSKMFGFVKGEVWRFIRPELAKDQLDEAEAKAIELVGQIQWVDLADAPVPNAKSNAFRDQATGAIRTRGAREMLKQIVANLFAKLHESEAARWWTGPDALSVAADAVAKAIKGWLVANDSRNRWLKRRRLAVKFESIELPWVQES